ncbi:MAG: hypothetical protein OXF06_00010 [Bacteroidetes bacterium]|nr:hypothetical protein [Bacteroidota bacterium]
MTGTSPSESKLFRSELHSLWQKCNKKLKRIGRYAYVIIDGLHHIDPQESAIREAIWELMPHHHAQIKILCSVDLNSTALPSMDRVKAKPYPVNNFAPFESCEYLGDVIPDKKRIEKFHEKYGGHPASLASLRRQVRFLNEKYDDPILDFPTDTKELLRKEWTISKPKSPEIVKAIATLIADGRPLSHTTLAKYCGLSEKNISEELRHLPFLKYSNNNATWEFHCNGIREIVQSSIVSEVKHARELIAESYLTNPDSSESLSQLPQYLEDATQSENLLSWLTEDRIIKILREDETAADLESTLRKAITVYKNAQQYEGLLAYSLSSSTIKYLTNSENLNDEIGARAALGDFDGAMKLVNSVPLLTRRLRLMAVVLNAFSDEDGVRLDTLRSEFEAILRQFDWSSLPNDEAISIAEDIYPVDPAWGLDILNKVVGADGGEGALDLALARISLSAIQSKASDQLSRKSDDQDPIPDYRLIDNKLRQFLDAVGRVLEAKSASDILSAVTTIQEPSQKLFLLRKWSLQNSFKKDAILITERAINLSIESIPSVLTADFFREITTALPYCEEYETIEEIIKILDGQDHIIKKRGPTVEYVRLHLQIVKSDWNRGNIERAINRMDQLYCGTIDKLAESSSTQLSCLAWFISIVSTLKGVPEIDDCDTWVEISEERYNSCRNEILLNSADQLEIVQGALQALAVNVPHKACDLSSRLNTEDRQMIGYRVILDTICRSPITSPKFDTTSNILTILIATEYYDSAILQITLRLCSDVEDKKQTISEVKWIFDFFDHCNSAIIRIKCMASLLAVVTNESGCRPIKEQLEREIISTFNGIISETDKYNAACILLAKLKGKVDECELAVSHVLTFLRELKGDRPLDRVTYKGLYWILDLLAKSVRGLAESGGLNERDVERVCSLIHSVNNESLKLTLNASIAIYLWNVGLNDMYANIVNNRLWPTLNALSSGDLSTKYKMWAKVYPALWLQNRDRARNGIEEFPDWVRERCNTSLCYTILRRQPLADPFDDQARNRRISRSYDDVSNLLQVCSESNSDDLIASIYTWIADELTGKNPKQKLTEEQMAEVARKMYDLADRKLPITSGIKHDGYRILCQAQALRISKIDDCSWGRLTDEAKNLDNHADRIFVLAHLGMEYKKKKEGIKLLHEVEKDCGELLTYEDRLNRYYAIASIVVDWDKKLARTIIKKAYEEVAGIGVKNIGIKERDLIDLAYRIDPALPMELAVVYDQDSVRREYYENRAQQELKTLEVKGNIVNNKISQKDKENEQNEKVFASAVRRALQSLNSGMLAKVDSERCREMIQRASESPLDTAYPIYSWALASLALSHSGKGARQNYLRDAFEGVLRGAKLYCSLTEVTGSYLEPPDWEDLSMKNDPLIVGIGQRQKAVDFIQRWIRERAEDFLIIADPYFDDTHLEILMHVLKSDHQMTVFVVTGGKKKEDLNYQNLRNAWKKICEQEPPITEITIVYVADDPRKRAPFHDRWLLSNGVGLNLGTSYNSLGNSDSTIRQMSDTELRTISERIEPYRKGKTMIDGKKLVYNKFELAH